MTVPGPELGEMSAPWLLLWQSPNNEGVGYGVMGQQVEAELAQANQITCDWLFGIEVGSLLLM